VGNGVCIDTFEMLSPSLIKGSGRDQPANRLQVAGSLSLWRPRCLVERRSEPRSQRRTLDPKEVQQAVDLRHQRWTSRNIARLLAATLSTVGRNLKAVGLGRLKDPQSPVPVLQYQWD